VVAEALRDALAGLRRAPASYLTELAHHDRVFALATLLRRIFFLNLWLISTRTIGLS
jgi:hypothetical protein